MKILITIVVSVFLSLPLIVNAQVEVLFRLEYDFNTQTYTVSINSNTGYTNPLSRISPSTQFSIVVPQIPGGWQVTNLMGLVSSTVPLGWGVSYLDGTTYGLSDDYLFFAPTNAGTYTPFTIPANTYLPLFSFQTSSGCVGDLSLYDNITDPLNNIPVINGDNNFVVLGAGPGNKYIGNGSGDITCVVPCTAEAGTLSY